MPKFGTTFTDHMVTSTWTPETGWSDPELRPYGPFQMDPSSAVLHYAQEIFEGLKAYRHPDGSIWTFRPDANAKRMRRSARRMAMPEVPEELFAKSVDQLVETDRRQVPAGEGESLYIRPFVFASEAFLGVRPALEYTFCVFGSPADAYFGDQGITVWHSETYTRAGVGGTGDAKCGGNYAASLLPQQEAAKQGCDQVAYTNERGEVDETGASNVFFVKDGRLVTPELSGTILDGITRDSVLTIARDAGIEVEERPVPIEEWRDGAFSEVFATGTAAVVVPIGCLRWDGGERQSDSKAGPITSTIRQTLLDIQYGRVPDPYNWLHQVC